MFYHLTRSPIEATLPQLLNRSLQAGWRVAVRGTSPDRLRWLDEKLWLSDPDGFLPHGLQGGLHDADQPVLLTTGLTLPNGATCVMIIDSAEVSIPEARSLDRVCIVFDGNDPAALDRARIQWRTLTEAAIPSEYWSEEGGKWQKKAGR